MLRKLWCLTVQSSLSVLDSDVSNLTPNFQVRGYSGEEYLDPSIVLGLSCTNGIVLARLIIEMM